MSKPTSELVKEARRVLGQDYGYLKTLNAEGWYAELSRLCKMSVDNDLGWFKGDPDICLFCRFGKPGEITETEIVHVGIQAVQFVGPNKGGGDPSVWLDEDRLPALIVNLNAADNTILTDLRRTLRAVRKYYNPIASPGRYSVNSRFDERTFKRWREHRLIEFANLLAWRAQRLAQDKSAKITNDFIADLLWKKYRDPHKKFNDVIKVLRKALRSLPALLAQVAQENEAKQIAEEMTAKRM